MISNKLKKNKITEKDWKIFYKRLFLYNHCFLLSLVISSCFSFFPHLIYLPEHIFDKKKMGVIFKQKDKK